MASGPSRSTATLVKALAAVAGGLVAAVLLWGMRSLILPVAAGGLLAYICYPIVAGLERFRLPRGFAIALLMLAFVTLGIFVVSRVRAGVPSELGALELRVRALRNVNRRYKALMGLDSSLKSGNDLYRIAHDDLDPLVDRMNRQLALTPEEQARFLAAHPDRPNASSDSDPLLAYHRENEETLRLRGRMAPMPGAPLPEPSTRPPQESAKRPLKALARLLSTWVVAPAVFLFLLMDTGEIKRGFFRLVPNRLFEPALAVLADLDRTLGRWLRGVLLECAFLGGAVAVLLAVLGVPPGWAILIGLVAGATNPIPYVGSAVALLGGLSFLLVSDEVHPLLPVIGSDSVAIWMVVGALLIEVIKNLVFEPLVLGESVQVHPLVVLLGVLGGGLMFGLSGLVFALPTIAIFKTLVVSSSRQLKAYGLI